MRVPRRGGLHAPGCAAPPSPPGSALWLGVCFGSASSPGWSATTPSCRPAGPVPDPPDVGLPGHPGPARDHRHRGGAAAAGQAVDRLPAAASPRPPRGSGSWSCTALERGSIGVLVAAGDLPARHRPGQLRPVVPVGLLLPRHPLRRRLGRDRRAGRAHRGQAAGHPRGARRPTSTTTALDRPTATERDGVLTRRGLLRTTWLAAGVAVLATAGSTVPGCARSRCSAVRSGDGPQGVPVNKSATAADVAAAATEPGLPPHRGARRPRGRLLTRADLEALPQTTADAADRLRRGLERERRPGPASACATLLDLVGAPAGSDVRRRVAAGARGLPRHDAARRTSPTTTAPCWPSGSTARRWPSTTATRAG